METYELRSLTGGRQVGYCTRRELQLIGGIASAVWSSGFDPEECDSDVIYQATGRVLAGDSSYQQYKQADVYAAVMSRYRRSHEI